MHLLDLVRFVLGLAALLVGAEVLVRGASQLARAVRISPLVIGLTVVAFGTSAPELAVSLRAAAAGRADLAVGNVVGSNVFNVLFILGLSALLVPLSIDRKLVRLDVPVMVGVSVAVWALAADGTVSRLEGVALATAAVVYTVFLIWESRREHALATPGPGPVTTGRSQGIAVLLVLGGLVLLVLGSRWLVDGATIVARALGVGERVIGLTLVAAGTSLPEVAASVVATLRGERDIAVGNVVGSNVFNLLVVLGLSAASGQGLAVAAGTLGLDLPIMVAVAVACLPVFLTGLEIDRLEGVLFLVAWGGYTVLLYLGTAVSPYPLAAVFLLLVAVLSFSGRRGG